MLYVYKSHFIPVSQQEVDIFTPDGRYIYQGIIKVKEGSLIITEPVFKNNHIYLVLEDEEGETFIVKYKTKMPK